MSTDLLAFIDLVKWLLGGMMVLAGILWGVLLWETRQLRRSLHELRNELPKMIMQWAEVAIRQHREGK